MKFGKTIQRLCVDEWRKWYVDYKSLKKCIKRLQTQLEQQEWEEEEEEIPHHVNDPTSANTAAAAKRQVAENGQKMFLAALSKEAAKVNRLYLDEVTLWESQYEEMISVLRTYQTSTFTPLMTTHSSHKKAKQRARRLRKIKLKKQQQKKPFMGFVGTKQQTEQTSTSDDSDSPDANPEMSPSADPMQAAFGGSSTATDLESDTEIPEHLVRQFTSWCMQLDKMRSFCLLNHVAFIKIVKKYDKKVNRLIAASLRAKPATAAASASTSSSSSMDWDATTPIPSIRDECMSSIMLQPFYCSLRLANLITRAECVASLLTEQPSSADFQCPVCLDVLSNPVVLSCAHRFCWDCLARASSTQSKCPVCRKQQSLDPNVYQVNDCLDSFLACHFPNEYKPRKTSLPLCPPSNLTSPLLLLNTPAAQASASASTAATSSSSSSAPVRATRSNSKRYRTIPTTRSPLPGSLASLFSSISAQTQSVVDKEFASLFEGDSPTTATSTSTSTGATAMDRTSDAEQLSSSLPPISRSLPWSVHSTRTAQLLQARYSTAPVSMTPPVSKHSHGAISAGSSLPISPKIRPYDSELDCDTFDDLVSSEFFLGPGSAPITIPASELTKSKQQQRSILTPDGSGSVSASTPPSPSTLTSRLSPSAREFVPSSRATGSKSASAGEALSKTPELGQSMTQLTLRDDDAVMDDVEIPAPTLPTPTAGKSLLSDAVASVRASRQSDADTSASAAAAAVASAAAAAAATSPTSAAKAALVTTGAHALPDNNPVMGLEFGTTPDARPAMHDPIPVMTLNSISGLLQHATSGTYIALDIDETIHINKYQPCMMMSEKGIQAFQIILSASPAYKHLHFSAKNHLTKKMQTALHQKRFVEHNTGTVIQELQARGCHVFGLTARYSDMAAATVRELHSLGIDFTLTSPFPKGKMMRDPSTEAVCQDGIIFTNANEKGPIFDRFLSSILIHGGADGQTFIPVPQHIVFADDREQNAQSVLTGLSVAEKLNIRITSYHYVPPATCHDAGDDGDDAGHDVDAILAAAAAVTAEYAAGSPTMSSMQLDSGAIEIDILQFQIHHFLNTTHILSDHQARRLWSAHKTSTSAVPKQLLQQSQPMEIIKGNKNKKSGLTPTVNYNKRPATTHTTVAGVKKQQTGASHNPILAAASAQASASSSTTIAASSTSTSHSMSRPIPIPTRAR